MAVGARCPADAERRFRKGQHSQATARSRHGAAEQRVEAAAKGTLFSIARFAVLPCERGNWHEHMQCGSNSS